MKIKYKGFRAEMRRARAAALAAQAEKLARLKRNRKPAIQYFDTGPPTSKFYDSNNTVGNTFRGKRS
jgi:hypothetical protein